MSATTSRAAAAPVAIARTRELFEPALRDAVERIDDPRMRLVAGYQMGWWDADGHPVDAGGKAIRPALAVLSAEAAGGPPQVGLPGASAVELVHNFSLLHDDIMDRDVERRHRPTGWVAFGEGQAILAGNAMLTAAIDELVRAGVLGQRALPWLLGTVHDLIGGQSADLALEGAAEVTLADVLTMEGGKTAALIACAASIGALLAGAPPRVVDQLAEYGRLTGLAFQLVDDVLGVVGDPAVTGKSASSDVRAGKRSAVVVAALQSGTAAATQLDALLRDGPPQTDQDVTRAVGLIQDAGGIDWAQTRADQLLTDAIAALHDAGLPRSTALDDLDAVAHYVVQRDR